jgi:hypothetical protein
MQVSGPVQGVSTIPRRRRLNVLLAIAAIVVLMVWAGALARSGVEAEDANPNAEAGSAVIHDAGNVNRDTGSAVIHDDPWNLNPN